MLIGNYQEVFFSIYLQWWNQVYDDKRVYGMVWTPCTLTLDNKQGHPTIRYPQIHQAVVGAEDSLSYLSIYLSCYPKLKPRGSSKKTTKKRSSLNHYGISRYLTRYGS